MPLYNINWSRFAVNNLNFDLRKIKLASLLISFIEPVKIAYNDFLQFRRNQIYESQINGQTIKLERVLNDTYDPVQRRIYITDGDYLETPVFYYEWKNRPVVFRNPVNASNPRFYSQARLGNRVSVNFYVHVPSDVFFEKDRISATVMKYKIFGRTFEVIII